MVNTYLFDLGCYLHVLLYQSLLRPFPGSNQERLGFMVVTRLGLQLTIFGLSGWHINHYATAPLIILNQLFESDSL
jgi:hypothetical protein